LGQERDGAGKEDEQRAQSGPLSFARFHGDLSFLPWV
jgi:hypothetical protein